MLNNSSGRSSVSTDAEIERDVAELRQLLVGVEGPAEPHPAYWENFVVHVRRRIDKQRAPKRFFRFSPAWTSLGAVAVVTVIVVSSGILNGPHDIVGPIPDHPDRPSAMADFSEIYSDTETKSLILSHEDVTMINAIVSDRDEAVFEALVASDGGK